MNDVIYTNSLTSWKAIQGKQEMRPTPKVHSPKPQHVHGKDAIRTCNTNTCSP